MTPSASSTSTFRAIPAPHSRFVGSRCIAVLSALSALFAAACSFNDPNPNELLPNAPQVTIPDIAVDASTALTAIANQAYMASPAFTQASILYPSTKDPVDIIEWVSTDAAAAYAQISPDPDAGPANVALPTGSVIVRAVYDLPDAGYDGAVQYLTILVKGPSGSNPIIDDWWFGVTDPNGNPLLFPDGGSEVGLGMTGQCDSCHTGRGSANDYLFGVPTAYRAPSFAP
jgi:hypothetical protein